MHFCEAKLPIHIKMERAIGEGPKELPTESKMLESTRPLINSQDEYCTRAAHDIARAKKDRNSSTTRSTLPQYHQQCTGFTHFN